MYAHGHRHIPTPHACGGGGGCEEEEEEEEEEDAGRARAARKTRQQQAQAGKAGVGAAAAGAGPFIDTRHERGGREREREALCKGNLPKEEMERDLSCVTAHDGDAGSDDDVKRLSFKRLAVSAWLFVPRRRLR